MGSIKFRRAIINEVMSAHLIQVQYAEPALDDFSWSVEQGSSRKTSHCWYSLNDDKENCEEGSWLIEWPSSVKLAMVVPSVCFTLTSPQPQQGSATSSRNKNISPRSDPSSMGESFFFPLYQARKYVLTSWYCNSVCLSFCPTGYYFLLVSSGIIRVSDRK